MAFEFLLGRLKTEEKPSFESAQALRTRLIDGGHISRTEKNTYYHAWRGADRQVANLAQNIVQELGLSVESVTRKEKPQQQAVAHPAMLAEVGDCPL
jgi:hypothetical protein